MNDRRRTITLISCCFINLCLGSIYSWSVFAQAMATYLSQTVGLAVNPGDLAIAYTVANCIGPVTMIAGGRVNDLFGPRLVILVGGLLYGAGLFSSSFAQSVGFIIVSFGIVGGLGLGMAYGSVISTAVKLFPQKSGLMGGVTTAAYGISSVLIPPIVSSIVDRTDAPTAFRIVGVAFLVVVAVATIFIRVPAPQAPAAGNDGADRASETDVDWRHMIRMSIFYVMLVLLICGAFSGMMVISQASAIAVSLMGFSTASAAVAVSIIAVFNTLGRIGAGSLSDRMGRIGTLRLACAISAVAEVCLLLASADAPVLFYGGIILAGLSFGSFMGVYPGFTADRFGLRNNSVNYGVMCIGFALAGYFGPLIASSVFNGTGSYHGAFLYSCLFSVGGLALTFVYGVLAARIDRSAVRLSRRGA